MFDYVDAIRYDGQVPFESGANQPVIVAVDHNGNEVDVFAKLTDKDCTPHGLVREAIAAFLAFDLNIQVPEMYRVRISEDFIGAIEDRTVQQRFLKSARVVFGTRKIDGFGNTPKNFELDAMTRQAAAEIWAFDMLIDNTDRGGGGGVGAKANCLTNGSEFYAIDHEKAFFALDSVLLGRKHQPWVAGNLTQVTAIDSHLFINSLRKLRWKPDFNNFMARWKEQVTDARLLEYNGAIPPEWRTEPEKIEKIFAGLREIRDNIEACLTEASRALSV